MIEAQISLTLENLVCIDTAVTYGLNGNVLYREIFVVTITWSETQLKITVPSINVTRLKRKRY